MVGRGGLVLAIGMGLAGCALSLPSPDSVPLDVPGGMTVPVPARVMIYSSDSDHDRMLRIQATRLQSEDTSFRDGDAQLGAARSLLARLFSRVAVNDPSIRPQIVVRLYGKGEWSRPDIRIRVGCGLDAFTADGFPLGSFPGRFEATSADYEGDLPGAHARCLKRPIEQFLASPALARLAAGGFRDPAPATVDAWMRTLGPMSPRP